MVRLHVTDWLQVQVVFFLVHPRRSGGRRLGGWKRWVERWQEGERGRGGLNFICDVLWSCCPESGYLHRWNS